MDGSNSSGRSMKASSRPGGDRATAFRFGEFTFDCASRQLMCGSAQRHLSLKAHELLKLLLLAWPRALSREELYDALWPSTFVCETNLACVVNEVRRALADDARASRYIRTVHGFGYAFCGEVTPAITMSSIVRILVCEEQSHALYEGENLIGRAEDCRVVILAPTISRHHALITLHPHSFTIRDLDSRNGTYVDGQRIAHLPVSITEGVQLGFGALKASIIFPRRISSTDALQMAERGFPS